MEKLSRRGTGSRFIIGIDLGTSNSALAYIDTNSERPEVSVLDLSQAEEWGRQAKSEVLPSFLYLLTTQEVRDHGVSSAPGLLARKRSAEVPDRVISSAKSWLCSQVIDREENILPWQSRVIEYQSKLSPVEASAEYLRFMKDAWDTVIGVEGARSLFKNQQIIITVPASFDESAQHMTLKAAELAGFPEDVCLIEEPQAAFYSYLEGRKAGDFNLSAGDTARLLVVDVGGGTSDFSLFSLESSEEGEIDVERISVSDHILLGGDNIDLALSSFILNSAGKTIEDLERKQFSALTAQARVVKEKVLSSPDDYLEEDFHFSVAGKGSDLFARALSVSVTGKDIVSFVTDSFFPFCSAGDRPVSQEGALFEAGLNYASDTAVTRYLAEFLEGKEIDFVLFNGGSLYPVVVRKRVCEILNHWQAGRGEGKVKEVKELNNLKPDLAVARGAARYGSLLDSGSSLIKAKYPRSVYVELQAGEGSNQLLCVLPKGSGVGKKLVVRDLPLQAVVDEPVSFSLYFSNTEISVLGEIVSEEREGFKKLASVQTVLRLKEGYRKTVSGEISVMLEAVITETGLFELYVLSEEHNKEWKLQWSLRKEEEISGEESADISTGVSEKRIERAKGAVKDLYGKRKGERKEFSPKRLIKELEKVFSKQRSEWNLALLRELWEPLSFGITRRGRSLGHETAWLYLAGFVLRPGFGSALDEVRIDELWRVYELGLDNKKVKEAFTQWCVMWRRVAGGLDRIQQGKLFKDIFPRIQKKSEENPEAVRLLGSLERAGVDSKVQFANFLLKRILDTKSSGSEYYYWSLARVGTRNPLYGNMHDIIPPAVVEKYFERLKRLDWSKGNYQRLNEVFSVIGKRTGNRDIDLNAGVQAELLKKLESSEASEEQIRRFQGEGELSQEELGRFFGDKLPAGLKLGSE